MFSDSPGSLFGNPIVHFQVTRLKCGGFILGVLFNHILSGVPGFAQFLTAVGELARGLAALSVQLVWKRQLLMFKNRQMLTSEDHGFGGQEEPESMTMLEF